MTTTNVIVFDPNRRGQRAAAKSSCSAHSDVDYSTDDSCHCENVDSYEAASLRRSRVRGRGRSYLVHLILRAGLATSAHEARHMFVNGEICYTEKGRDLQLHQPGRGRNVWSHGRPMDRWTWAKWGSSGDITLDDDANVILRSECVKCSRTTRAGSSTVRKAD